MLLSDGAPAEDAVTHAREAVKADADLSHAHYTLGLAALAARNTRRGRTRVRETSALNPRAAAAQMQLAQDPAGARRCRPAPFPRRSWPSAQSPTDAAGRRAARADASGAGQSRSRPRRELSRAAARRTRMPRALHSRWAGVAAAPRAGGGAQRVPATRCASPRRRSTREPDSSPPISPNAEGRRRQGAGRRMAPGRLLRSRARRARRRASRSSRAIARRAERILREVLSRDAVPDRSLRAAGAASTRRRARSIARCSSTRRLAQRSPSSAAGARTMIGMLHEARKDRRGRPRRVRTGARRRSESRRRGQQPGVDLAEEGKLDDALRLALVAQRGAGRRPEADDTLGWIYLPEGAAARGDRGVRACSSSARRRTRSITTISASPT